jgi:integrase
MASIIERDGRWRALIRKGGHTRCATFDTKGAAKDWAEQIERQVDELRASGVMQARGMTLGDLIDRYTREIYPLKPWGRTKSADLARLKADLGHLRADTLTSAHFTEHFRQCAADGTGSVSISSLMGYLVGVLRVARTLWHLDISVQAAVDARHALAGLRLLGKSKSRDRRVTDQEVKLLVAHFAKDQATSSVPMSDIVQFCVASAMRISEVTRITWDDFDKQAKTVIVRNRKHPTERIGNDQVVPLLNATGHDAFKIVQRQPRTSSRIFPFNSRTVSTYFTEAVKALKLEDLHLHDLRHEGISRLFDAGYQIQQVALVSGHSDWAMLKRYTHVKAADLHRPPVTR